MRRRSGWVGDEEGKRMSWKGKPVRSEAAETGEEPGVSEASHVFLPCLTRNRIINCTGGSSSILIVVVVRYSY